MITKTCAKCQQPFRVMDRRVRCCSRQCAGALRRVEIPECRCQRPACGQVFIPDRPFLAAQRKYCSIACSVAMVAARKAASAKGGRISAIIRRQKVRDRVAGMTPVEAYKYGYQMAMVAKSQQKAKLARSEAA